MSYEIRIILGTMVIEKLIAQVGAVSANRGIAKITDTVGLSDHATPVAAVYAVLNQTGDYGSAVLPSASFIAATVAHEHGNCDMKAELVYQTIMNKPQLQNMIADTTVHRVFIAGHAFCILSDLGLPAGAGPYDIADFGDDAVVCDLWQEDCWTPNTWLPHGTIPGVERLFWRGKIKTNQITIIRSFDFACSV
ncbi:hypothetical protein [Pseudomonas sp. TNT2022 ID642]|jgi:hypothetical protein|uniref:hypothetical protein n=1 Tax=Pseudomonas sp. TNT2022 ID642 TaxID=2942632 RepID=UPI000F03270D|nr:hypothetical protein [Pseudomonas sp. TNT2022 ID642]MDD1002705.1 hypothetical protein [Pseudomonas sp. TNT2022 ID642]